MTRPIPCAGALGRSCEAMTKRPQGRCQICENDIRHAEREAIIQSLKEKSFKP